MPWPTVDILLLFILVAMLQIKELDYYQPNIFLPFLFLSPLCCLMHPLHSSLLFFFRKHFFLLCLVTLSRSDTYASTSHLKSWNCRMLRLDGVYLAGPLRASHPIIRWTGLLLTVCSSLPLIVTHFLLCGVLAKPDWTETRTQNASQRVYVILLLLCVFVYPTAELPLTVLYLSLPLRKLLQYLWMLCNSVCARVCERVRERGSVCVCLWMQGSGKSTTHLSKLFPVLLQFVFFFFSCSLQLKPGFYHKAVESVRTIDCKYTWTTCLLFLPLYKDEAKISLIWVLPSFTGEVIWSQNLRSSHQDLEQL